MLVAPRVSNQVGKQIAHSTIEDFKSLKSEATADEVTDEKRSEQSEINQEHQGSQKSSETVLGENRENIPKEILLHCCVFIELKAKTLKKLRDLQSDITMELTRSKLSVDKLTLRQKKVTRLSQHIAFLKDFFRSYKDFSDAHIDTIELMLIKLYNRFGITDTTDYSLLKSTDYPTMSDFYDLCEKEYKTFDGSIKPLYSEDILREVCLGLNSMCIGAESKYFNGYTNINDSEFLVFGVKGLMDTNKKLKDVKYRYCQKPDRIENTVHLCGVFLKIFGQISVFSCNICEYSV